MKALVSALTLGLVVAFSAPAFAATGNAYVGDMIGSKPAPKAGKAKTAENKTSSISGSLRSRSLHWTQPAAPAGQLSAPNGIAP
jgi:hypothetical protein